MEKINEIELKEEEIELLYSLFPNEQEINMLRKSQEGNKFYISNDERIDLMLFIDDAIVLKGMINQDYLNPIGVKLQGIYDSLFVQLNNSD